MGSFKGTFFPNACLPCTLGKMIRGSVVWQAFKLLRPEASSDDNRLAVVLGWCVEWLQACFLVADDIMDQSVTRRGKSCWYKRVLKSLPPSLASLTTFRQNFQFFRPH